MDNNVDSEITAVRPAIADAAADDVVPGGTIGDVRLGQLVGRGISSEVYRGENLIAHKPCAVKVLHAEAGGAVARGRYSHEAKRLAALDLPGVADIYGFGRTAASRLYVTLEWIEGHVLRDLIRQHAPLSQRNFTPLIRQLCTTLGAPHAAGFAHRRLHGGNVLVQWPQDGQPRVKLLDFGVWHVHPALDDQAEENRPAEQAVYLAPEQIKGEPGDSRSDIYALGVLLYEMLTGKVPFLGETFGATTEQHLNAPVRPPSELATIPPGIEETILRALEKDPKRRIPSVEALLGAFDPLSATTTGQHAQLPAQGKIRALTTGEMKLKDLEAAAESGALRAVRPPSADVATLQPATLRPPKKRRLWLLLALGAALLTFGGALAWMLMDDEEPAKRRTVRRPPRTRPAVRRTPRRPPVRRTRPTARPGRTRPPATAVAPTTKTGPLTVGSRRPGSPVVGARMPLDRLRLRKVDPNAKHGTVSLTAPSPTARFFLDGRFVGGGQRRVLRRVPVGKHKLHAVVNGRKSPIREIDLQPNQQLSLAF